MRNKAHQLILAGSGESDEQDAPRNSCKNFCYQQRLDIGGSEENGDEADERDQTGHHGVSIPERAINLMRHERGFRRIHP